MARNGINQAHFCREVETMDGTDKWKSAHSCNERLETLAGIQLMASQWAAVLH